MGDFRARDADRDRCVEVIEAAYVDGQLGDADRELRVSRALTAETLDELEGLTRDLQPPVGVMTPAVPRTRGPEGAPRRVAGPLAAAIGLVLAGAAALAMFAGTGHPDSATSDGVRAPAPIESAEAVEVPEAASFRMTAPQVRRFLRAHRAEFGTLEVFDAAFYPTRVGVQVPVPGSRPRSERWTWKGSWRRDTKAAAVTGPGEVIDLGSLDVKRLFANIETALQTLQVEDGKLTHVLVHRWSGVPTVDIHVGNTFGESGYLMTTLAGDVISPYPYRP